MTKISTTLQNPWGCLVARYDNSDTNFFYDYVSLLGTLQSLGSWIRTAFFHVAFLALCTSLGTVSHVSASFMSIVRCVMRWPEGEWWEAGIDSILFCVRRQYRTILTIVRSRNWQLPSLSLGSHVVTVVTSWHVPRNQCFFSEEETTQFLLWLKEASMLKNLSWYLIPI